MSARPLSPIELGLAVALAASLASVAAATPWLSKLGDLPDANRYRLEALLLAFRHGAVLGVATGVLSSRRDRGVGAPRAEAVLAAFCAGVAAVLLPLDARARSEPFASTVERVAGHAASLLLSPPAWFEVAAVALALSLIARRAGGLRRAGVWLGFAELAIVVLRLVALTISGWVNASVILEDLTRGAVRFIALALLVPLLGSMVPRASAAIGLPTRDDEGPGDA